MTEFQTGQNAARLSEDIGDVLSAIRKLISADEMSEKSEPSSGNMGDADPAETLARRYGGEAGLARQLVQRKGVEAQPSLGNASEDEWPFGAAPNGPETPETSLRQARIMRHSQFPDEASAIPETRREAPEKPPRRVVKAVRYDRDAEVVPNLANAANSPTDKRRGTPLQLEAAHRICADRVEMPSGEIPVPGFIRARHFAQVKDVSPVAPKTAQSDPVDDDANFAEAFDWKANLGATSTAEPAPQPSPAQPKDAVAVEAVTPESLALASDEEIREVLREMIREEMHGDLGQRFSRNLRAVIRREVAAAIDEQMDRF